MRHYAPIRSIKEHMKRRPQTLVSILGLMLLCSCSGTKSRAGAQLESGTAHLDKGEYDLAIRDFDEAIRLDSVSADAYRNRGIAFRGKEDFDRAIQDYDKAVTLAPNDARIFQNRAMAYQGKGEFDVALRDFDQAVKLKPDFGLAWKNRGRTDVYLGRFPDAAADLAKGQSLDPANLYVAIWLHFVNRRIGRDDAKDFAAHVARTDTVKWPAPVAKYYLGRLTADGLFAAAEDKDTVVQTQHRCAASFYIGEELLAMKRDADAATRFLETKAACPRSYTEYDGAIAELRRLGVSGK